MKEVNFRIIELPTHQVLLMKDFDNESDHYMLKVVFSVNGLRVTQGLGFDTEEKQENAFENFSDELAQAYVNSALRMISPKSLADLDEDIANQ